jgi:hypothetical protein
VACFQCPFLILIFSSFPPFSPKCDGFMVGSTKTDPSIGAVNIPHEGPEECEYFLSSSIS